MISYIVLGTVVVFVLYFVLKLAVLNINTAKLNKNIFEHGVLCTGTVIGYIDYDNRRHTDDSKDVIYTGGDIKKDSYCYTSVILEVVNSDGTKEEVVLEGYTRPGEDERLLSSAYKLGMEYEFYEYEGNRRFANTRWLVE